MAGDEVERDGGLVVGVEVGPVERDHDLRSPADHEGHPAREQVPDIDAGVREEAVHLLDRVLGLKLLGDRQRPAEGADRELSTLQRAHRRVGERRHALRMEVVVEDRGDELVHAAGADGLVAHGPRTMISTPRIVYNLPHPMTVGMRGSVSVVPARRTSNRCLGATRESSDSP